MNRKSLPCFILAISLAVFDQIAAAQDDVDLVEGAPVATAILVVDDVASADSVERELRADLAAEYPATAPLEWVFTVISRYSAKSADVVLRIRDGSQTIRYEGVITLPLVPGPNPVKFVIPAGELPEGEYTAHVTARGPDDTRAAVYDIVMRKISAAQVSRDLSRLEDELAKLRGHLEGVAADAAVSTHSEMRLAIAHASLERSKASWDDGEWRVAGRELGYVERALKKTRGELTFAATPGATSSTASHEPIRIGSGGFTRDSKPVFLSGLVGWEELGQELGRLQSFGMNYAVFPVDPSDGIGWLDAALDRAARNSVTATVVLTPPGMGSRGDASSWLLEGEATLPLANDGGVSLGDRAADVLALANLLDGRESVNSLAFAVKPRFVFTSEGVRQDFVSYLQERYESREELNRAWKARLRDFDDVTLEQELPRPSFRYDRSTFQQMAAQRYVRQAVNEFKSDNPELPLQMVFSDELLTPRAGLTGVHYEWLTNLLDVTGASIGAPETREHYAIDHPRNSLLYTLLSSMSPGNPVVNPVLALVNEETPKGSAGYDFAYGTVWDSIMSGLDGMAMHGWQGGSSGPWNPDALEGFAAASLDVNRLSELVTAYQNAPADLAIMWSVPSSIYEGGDPYLDSLRRAFEGTAFAGRKVRFISEQQCIDGELNGVRILVIPQMFAMSEEAFKAVQAYIAEGGGVVRSGYPIPYDEGGHSRTDVITYSVNTVLMRGLDTSTGYLHAMENQYASGSVPQDPRAVNAFGYLLEGVKSRYLEWNGEHYVYVMNLRKDEVVCHLSSDYSAGYDLISGVDVSFPKVLEPLAPILVRLTPPNEDVPTETVAPVDRSAPKAVVRKTGRS